MKENGWFWLATSDVASNNWILHQEGPPVTLRPRYRHLCCPECGKVDEDEALRSGLDDIKLRARSDIFHTSDRVLCFSERAREIFAHNDIRGLTFLPLATPNKQNHQIALPTVFCPVDRARAGFQYNRFDGEPAPDNAEVFCQICHRPREGSYVGPLSQSLTLPDDPFCVFAPSIPQENLRGKVHWILVSHIVKDIIKQARVIGAQPIRAL